LWFPWSQRGFQCDDNSLKLVVALAFKQWIPGQLAAIDLDILEKINTMKRENIIWKKMNEIYNNPKVANAGLFWNANFHLLHMHRQVSLGRGFGYLRMRISRKDV
jgi:hypothetical protein